MPGKRGEKKPRETDDCGSCFEAAMSVIGGRWKCAILCTLYSDGVLRFSELQRNLGGISSRILSKQLKELEDDEMITRTVASDRKLKVTYALSSKGESILPIIGKLAEWGAKHQSCGAAAKPGDSFSAGSQSHHI